MIDMRHELAAQCACRDDLFAQKAKKESRKAREEKTTLQHDAKQQPTASSILEKETRGRKAPETPLHAHPREELPGLGLGIDNCIYLLPP